MNTKNESQGNNKSMLRLHVALANAGIASRRKCEEFIKNGRVKINGQVVTTPGTRIIPSDIVEFDGRIVSFKRHLHYIALYKPAGYLCAMSDDRGRPLAVDLLRSRFKERLYNVGRLDFASSGLIFFTNDGDFAEYVMHPSFGLDKEYLVETDNSIPLSFPDEFQSGIVSGTDVLRAENVKLLDTNRLSIILAEGKNREIRRALESAGLYVKRLIRVRIGPISLGSLREGDFCELNDSEVKAVLSYHYNKE